ncbi:Fe-S protein assembly co-chaperone HscB [Candidatus Bealeia paramacronuclearis]|uniref:Fe-S protein assembly co-chaperone HscB n=1 Tax=Candidatus Bealeia paramacronuclearis TaxID=1921001 RepID=A0ABZ2C4E7_9PROT|nr:Fe-S protein assembly co-chaperone HscB [Candidatus Bealeia paramacronuclearis]
MTSQNPYTLLELEPTFAIDIKTLDQQYFKLQRQFHPDRFAQHTEEERKVTENHSSLLNYAYQNLKRPIERAKSLAQLLGHEIEVLRSSETILVEAMHWRERVLVTEVGSSDLDTLSQELQQDMSACLDAIDLAFMTRDFSALSPLVTKLSFLEKVAQDIKKKGQINVTPNF